VQLSEAVRGFSVSMPAVLSLPTPHANRHARRYAAAVARKAQPRPDGTPPAVAGLPAPRPWFRVDEVEVFAVGEHRDGDRVWTAADLRQIAANFRANSFSAAGKVDPSVVALSVDVGLGHEEAQKILADSGLPAAGYVTALRYDESAGKLVATFRHVPAEVAAAIRDKRYSKVSAEIYDEPPPGVPGRGPMLRRVVLLGGELPAVKALRPLPVPAPDRAHSELARRTPARPLSPTYRLYADGGTPMAAAATPAAPDRKAAEDKLRGIGWNDEMIAALDQLDDASLTKFALAALAAEVIEDTGEGVPADDPNAPPPMAHADHSQMVADIMAADPSQDQATLDAMSDDDLLALCQQLQIAGYSETPPVTDTATKPKPAPNPPAPKPQPQPRPAPEPQPAPAPHSEQALRQYAEAARRDFALARRERIRAQQASEQALRRIAAREAEERRREIHAFCESERDAGRVSPAELDKDPADPAALTLSERLMLLDAKTVVRKFSDAAGKEVAQTALEMEMDAIRRRSVRRYGETIHKSASAATGPKAEARALVASYYAERAKGKKPGSN
jgi:hypothetical protein